MGNTQRKALKSALEWYVDHGVDEALLDETLDRTKMPKAAPPRAAMPQATIAAQNMPQTSSPSVAQLAAATSAPPPAMLGKADAHAEAVKLAASVNTLDELKEAIAGFEGLTIKKTATNMVFSDGNPEADIMVIGEAPAADEDRQGKPFVGESGQLLDKILGCINLSRSAEDVQNGVYISNILNWRPPGNRSPSPAEIAVSLPFIEKHIMLAKPKVLILCGGTPAKALLGKSESISRLRKSWHDYVPQTTALGYNGPAMSAIVTYHPAYLLNTPLQKKAVWADMLALQEKRNALNLK